MKEFQRFENVIQRIIENVYNQGYEDGQKEKPQAIYEMKVEEYNKGLNEAWEAVKKIALMDTETSENITGYFGLFRIMNNLTASEVITKIKEYEDKQKQDAEIKVGYEVYNLDPENKRIVTAIDGNKVIQLCSNGKYTVDNIDTLHWTGREDLRIKKVLEKITNEI